MDKPLVLLIRQLPKGIVDIDGLKAYAASAPETEVQVVVVGASTSTSCSPPIKKLKDRFNVRRTPNLYIENEPLYNNHAMRKQKSTKQVVCPMCLQTFDQSHFSVNQWTKLKPVCKQCIKLNN